MSEEQDPFEPMVRATLAESDQEPFEAMMRRMCDSVLRDMQPQVVQAEQARAELRDRFAMAALTGLLAARNLSEEVADRAFTIVAEEAWKQADAMLKGRGNE